MGRWMGLSSLIDFNFEHHHHQHTSFYNRSGGCGGMRLSTRYHKLDDSIFVLCRKCGNSMKSEEKTKMGSTPTSTTTATGSGSQSGRVRANPKHFLTWSAAMANNRIQKLSKNFVNNVSKLQSKMERVMPTFHPPPPPTNSSTSSSQNYIEQVENDLSEPNKDIHESCRVQVSKVHKIPQQSSSSSSSSSTSKGLKSNCEKNECKTGSGLSEGAKCCSDDYDDDEEDDGNEERYSGFTPSVSSYRAQLQLQQTKDILSNSSSDNNNFKVKTTSNSNINNKTCGEIISTSSPGFPHQIQSARIVQSFKAEVASTKSLVQSGHYKIPPNPTITPEALKQMIINSPTELNSCRKFEEKPQPIKYVDVDTNTNMLELRSLDHHHQHQVENQSKYNLSCGSSNSNGTTTSNNASLSDNGSSCGGPLRNTTNINAISSPQWSRTGSLSTYSSSNPAHLQKMPTASILKNSLTNAENEYDTKRNNNNNNNNNGILVKRRSLNGSLAEEISSHGIDNEGLSLSSSSGEQKPIIATATGTTAVSFSSPVMIESSSDKQSLLIKGKKSFTKRSKSNKNHSHSQAANNNNNNNNNNDNCKRSVQFQNPLSATSPRKLISPGAYPPSQLAVTIFEEESELRHAPWFQAGIPRDIALEVLRNEPIGSFIVRESTTKAGCFALSLRVPKEFKRLGIAHYLILKSGRGYKIKGFTKEFKSLNSLITHHSVMPELLPCPLSLHRYRPNHPQKISRFYSSDFVEPEKLVGFTNFVDCLEST